MIKLLFLWQSDYIQNDLAQKSFSGPFFGAIKSKVNFQPIDLASALK
jgi:hypothetical protein